MLLAAAGPKMLTFSLTVAPKDTSVMTGKNIAFFWLAEPFHGPTGIPENHSSN